MSSHKPDRGPPLLTLLLLLLQSCQGGAQPQLRMPVFQRLRRLDEQFQRFQERTVAELEAIGRGQNASSNLDARLQTLTDQYHNLSQDLTHLRNTTGQEMDSLREWTRKLQKKNKRTEARVVSMERSLRESSRETQRHRQEGETLSNLTLELRRQAGELGSLRTQRDELLSGLRGLKESLTQQDLRMSQLEGSVGEILQGNGVHGARGSGGTGTGDPLASSLAPRDPTPPRTQTSGRDRPRTSHHSHPEHHARLHSNPQHDPRDPPRNRLRSEPRLHSDPHSRVDSPRDRPPLGDTRERGMRTALQPPQPSRHPAQQEDGGQWGRGRTGPLAGRPQQGAVSQLGPEWSEGGAAEGRGWQELAENSREEEERREEGETERKADEQTGQRRRQEEVRTGESQTIQNLLQLPLRHKIPQQHTPKKEATICNVDSMILFPSASSENYVTFSRSFPNLPELSVCLWLSVDAGYVGTVLSYATEDNDNSLVLYGHNATTAGNTLDFVVGDPVYRRLPVNVVLDGRWHHLCFLWSSIEGRFWHYTDRRLTSTGSKFRKGFEVPGGGSVVLGQEQDVVGGGFDPAEGFVGRIAGFVVWDRVLSPREVAGVATGKGIPRGVVLTLEDVAGLHGEVQQVACECLEHCV